MDVNDLLSADIEVLAFRLGNEEYAIDIRQVQEIRGYGAVTTMANAPDYIKGVINLRGSIVPLVDMRIKFDLDSPTYDTSTVVIILGFSHQTIGIVVDGVADVIKLTTDHVQPPPQMGTSVNIDYVTGLGTINDRMLILLDIERLLSHSDTGLISELAA